MTPNDVLLALLGDTAVPDADALAATVLRAQLGPRRAEPKNKDRVACLQLIEAGRALGGGNLAGAERLLGEARRRLGPKHLRPLEDALRDARRVRDHAEAETRVAEAQALHADGDPVGALQALRKAIGLASALAEPHRAFRAQLEEEAAARTRADALQRRLLALLDAGQVFEAQDEAGEAPPAGAAERLQEALAAWAPEALTLPVPAKAGLIDIGSIGVATAQGQRVVVACDEDHLRVVAAAGQRVALLHSETLAPVQGFTLPADVSVQDPTARVFSSGDRVLVFEAATRRVTVLDATGPRTVAHRRLDRVLAGAPPPPQLAGEIAFDPYDQRILVNLPDTTGRADSRVVALDPERGTVVREERIPAFIFSLRRVAGTNLFSVQRGADPRRKPGKPFHYVLLDSKAQTVGRILLPELEQPLHAIRKMGILPDGGFLIQYWYADPLTGQPVEHGNALIRTRADQTVVYQSADIARWVGPGRLAWGAFEVLPPTESGEVQFVLPWVAPQRDGTARYGVSGVNLDRFERRWDVAIEPGATLVAVFGDRAGQLLLLLAKDNRTSLVSVKPPREAGAAPSA